MGTIRVRAGLIPVLRLAHEPNLRSSGCVIYSERKFGLFSFSKYYWVSTPKSDRIPLVHEQLAHMWTDLDTYGYCIGNSASASVCWASHGLLDSIPRMDHQPCCFTIPRPGTVLDDDRL